jgi:hypothetical protein
MIFTVLNIERKETTRGPGDALINVECSAKSLGPSFFYFLDICKNVEIVQRSSQTLPLEAVADEFHKNFSQSNDSFKLGCAICILLTD